MKKIALFLISLIVLLIYSCESFIDLHPLDQIGAEQYWKTSQDLENYIKRFYSVLGKDGRTNTDDLIQESAISTILNGERTTSTGSWSSSWANIRNINYFLDNYYKCEDDFDSYKQFLGEAYFLKSWYYFRLVRTYGDVPWYSHVIELDSEDELFRARDSRTLVTDSIIACLEKAVDNLAFRSEIGNVRISKEAALAFLSRIALYEGTWQKYHSNTPFGTSGANPQKYFQACVNASEELMSGNYTVGLYNTGNTDNDYFKLFGFDDMKDIDEIILWKAFNQAEGLSNNIQAETTYKSVGRGYTWDLVTSYLALNGEPYDFLQASQTFKGDDFLLKIAEECDPRLKSVIWIPGDLMSEQTNKYFESSQIDGTGSFLCPTGFQVKKHANPYSSGAGFDWDIGSETGTIIFRFAEVLLNYAEAKYEMDNTVAYTQLNMLRSRVGMADFSVNPQGTYSTPDDYGYAISDELYEIRRERRIELVDEGLRQYDLLRWRAHALFKNKRPKGYPYAPDEYPNYPSTQIDDNGLVDYFISELPNGYQFREGQDYLYSIPIDEITLNPNLEQNPGW